MHDSGEGGHGEMKVRKMMPINVVITIILVT
jgi:hypothetical protein